MSATLEDVYETLIEMIDCILRCLGEVEDREAIDLGLDLRNHLMKKKESHAPNANDTQAEA